MWLKLRLDFIIHLILEERNAIMLFQYLFRWFLSLSATSPISIRNFTTRGTKNNPDNPAIAIIKAITFQVCNGTPKTSRSNTFKESAIIFTDIEEYWQFTRLFIIIWIGIWSGYTGIICLHDDKPFISFFVLLIKSNCLQVVWRSW